MRLTYVSLIAAGALMMTASPALAQAQGTTYIVKQLIGTGTVVGQIATDGTTGTLSTANISAWNLALSSNGAAYTLTNANSSVVIVGSAVTATATNLSFDYGKAGTNYLLFQNGLYSGSHYWCNSSAAGACAQGATVAPNSVFDGTEQYETRTGVQVLGTAGPVYVTTTGAINKSLDQLAASQKAQLLTENLFSSVLLGKNEQVSCGDCGGADMTFGSFTVSGHGRKSITPELTVLYGMDAGQYEEKGAYITNAYTFAAGLRYDPSNMGASRPFLEIGGALTPDQDVSYQRVYSLGSGSAIGIGETKSSEMSLYARVGWVDRLTPRDELAGSFSLGRSWQTQDAYQETAGGANPFNAVYSGGIIQVSVAGLSGQYTHLFGRRVEVAIDATIARTFASRSSVDASIDGFGDQTVGTGEITYAEPGARVSYRVTRRLKIDAFINATIANRSIGNRAHGGFGVSFAF